MSDPKTKDETRWLARAIAMLTVFLGYHILVILIHRIIGDEYFNHIAIVLGIVVVGFLFWLSYRLLRCASLWDMLTWTSDVAPGILLWKCYYLDLNKHIRCGLIAGFIFSIINMLLGFMCKLYGGIVFWDMVRSILIICWYPVWKLINISNSSEIKSLFFVIIVLYTWIIGFIVGWGISHLKHWLRGRKKEEAVLLEELRQGS
jgi:hypothetical protein